MNKQKAFGPVFIQDARHHEEAEAAVQSLMEAGFTSKQISVVIPPSEVRPRGGSSDLGEGGATLVHAPLLTLPGRVMGLARALAGSAMTEGPKGELVIGGHLVPIFEQMEQKPEKCHLSRALRRLGVEKEEAEHHRKELEAGLIVIVAACELAV